MGLSLSLCLNRPIFVLFFAVYLYSSCIRAIRRFSEIVVFLFICLDRRLCRWDNVTIFWKIISRYFFEASIVVFLFISNVSMGQCDIRKIISRYFFLKASV